MLVLSRRIGQKLLLPTLNTEIEIVAVKSGVVRLGIQAPEHVAVFREELLDDRLRQQLAALSPPATPPQPVPVHQINNRLNSATIGLALLRQQLDRGLQGPMAATLLRLEQEVASLKQSLESTINPPKPDAAPARPRALLVEDDVNECELLAGFLRMAGLDVTTASDGGDALDHLRQYGAPDVMLLDMLLPRTDGPTTVRAIRGNPVNQGLRIFGITGADPQRFDLPQGQGGIDLWFRKPLDPQALLDQLARELHPRR